MRSRRTRRNLLRPAPLFLVVLALVASLLDAGSLPHVHAASKAGLYNQEHDLVYLATFSGAGLVPESPLVVPFAAVVLLVVPALTRTPSTAPRRHADFRAPPAR